jgi:predicted enzyme related to lactoylglutathione lyase
MRIALPRTQQRMGCSSASRTPASATQGRPKCREVGLVGVRAPLRETEAPVVRPYWLVDNIEAAVAAAVEAGGEIAHPPMEIPGHGTFAIYLQGGIDHGFWQR